MVERLGRIAEQVDTRRNRFANSDIVDDLSEAPIPADPLARFSYERRLAEQELYAGRHEAAIERFEGLRGEVDAYQADAPPGRQVPASFRASVLDLLAIAYLRLAERELCVEGPSATACRMPTSPGEGRADLSAARSAIRVYESILADDPDQLGPRWLINLAYMLLGEYPDGVPARRLIPPELFEAEHDVGRFRDVAPALGLNVVGNVGGSIMDDFSGDGLLDIMVSSWGLRDQLLYFRNDGDGGFTDVTDDAGLTGLLGGGNLIQADYDNDGNLDVFVMRGGWLQDGFPNSLLRNNGDGTFSDVTEAVGLLPPHATQTAAWGDYDNDGRLDLYVGNESFGQARYSGQLYHNNGDGTFTDVAVQAGAAVVGPVKGVVWGDVDNDGRLDLYLALKGAPNVLLHNDGPDASGLTRFSDRTTGAGVAEPFDAFPTWFWDYDNDGWTDLFVAGYRTDYGDALAEYLGVDHGSELPRLYRNRGDGTFEDATAAAGLDRILFAMGSNFGDLDSDGWLDFYVGTGDAFFQALMPNRMFRSAEGRSFQEVTTSGGFGLFQKGHGVAFGDIDHDGDQDVYQTMGGAYEGDLGRNVLFENPGNGNHWLSLRLEGVRSNRSAIGVRIRVTIATPSGERAIFRTVGSGGSFGASPLRQEIGLGEATAIRQVRITWPTTGRTDVYEHLGLDQAYHVIEGAAEPTPVTRTRLRLGG